MSLFTSKFERARLWDSIRAYFNPRQKWLTDRIPNTWCDKTELIPDLLFTCLIDFVESEKGTDQLNVDWSDDLAAGYITQEYVDSINTIYSEIQSAYEYAKNERPLLIKAHEDSYPDVVIDDNGIRTSLPYEEAYRENNRLEALLEKRDYETMHTIIKHVGVFWT
jgi:hypothetical protein